MKNCIHKDICKKLCVGECEHFINIKDVIDLSEMRFKPSNALLYAAVKGYGIKNIDGNFADQIIKKIIDKEKKYAWR